MRMVRHLVFLLIGLFVSIPLSSPAAADWASGGIPVCSATGDQTTPAAVPDGSGGAIVVWQDLRNGVDYNVYAQKLDPLGASVWATDGVAVCLDAAQQYSVQAVPDGAGGAIVAWVDERNDTTAVYAQRITPDGIRAWTFSGVAVTTISAYDRRWRMISDGAGGAIVAWESGELLESLDIRAQRIDPDGNLLWTAGGVGVAVLSGSQSSPAVAPDGAGGAIVAWDDDKTPWSDSDVYVQRVDGSGVVQWAAGGVPVAAGANLQAVRGVVLGASGDAVVAWWDESAYAFYAQRLDSAGNAMWTSGGVVLAALGVPAYLSALVADDSGGAILTWTEPTIIAPNDRNVYAQRVDGSGSLPWTTGPLPVFSAGVTEGLSTIADGSGGAIVCTSYHNGWTGDHDISAIGIDRDGSVVWSAPVASTPEQQVWPASVADGFAGVIVAWGDARNGDYDVYAHRIYHCRTAPLAIDFGTVPAGGYAEATFKIENVWNVVLSGTVSESCDHYAIVSGGGAYSLFPGDSLLVTVRFEPTTPGTHACVIETGDALCADVSCTGFACGAGVVYVAAGATGAGNGSSWADAIPELRDALAVASQCPGVTEIWVAMGTYSPSDVVDRDASFTLRSGVALYGGFAGNESHLAERDVAAHPTVLTGKVGPPEVHTYAYHVVNADGVDATAVLDGFTVTGGQANGVTTRTRGAGVYAGDGSPTLTNLTITGNTATSEGGGAYVASGSPTLTNVTFEGNSAGTSGGGLYNDSGSPQLLDVIFDANSSGGYGGGMSNLNGTPSVDRATFRSNTATGDGGGIFNNYASGFTVTNTVYDANTAGTAGGGLHTRGSTTLANVVFSANSAQSGGGVALIKAQSCQLINVTLADNTATQEGGALQSTFPIDATLLTNVIVWGNSTPAISVVSPLGPQPWFRDCLIQGGVPAGGDGGGNIDADPAFKGSDFPGSPYAIYGHSPAVNAGLNSAIPPGITTDVDGDPRIVDGTVDMGAYEHQGSPTGVDDTDSRLPTATALRAAYPNPFNPAVTVEFDLDRLRHVQVGVYDVQGRLVRTLLDGVRPRGAHRLRWEGTDERGNRVASGVYFLFMRSEGWSDHRKIVLLK